MTDEIKQKWRLNKTIDKRIVESENDVSISKEYFDRLTRIEFFYHDLLMTRLIRVGEEKEKLEYSEQGLLERLLLSYPEREGFSFETIENSSKILEKIDFGINYHDELEKNAEVERNRRKNIK